MTIFDLGDLGDLGFSKEEILERVVNQVTEGVLCDEDMSLDKMIKERVEKAVKIQLAEVLGRLKVDVKTEG